MLRSLYEKRITREDYYNTTFRDCLVIVGKQFLIYCPYENSDVIGMVVRKYNGHELAIVQALVEIGIVYHLGDINQVAFFETPMQQLSNIERLKEEHRSAILNKHYLEFYSFSATPAFLLK